MTAVLETQDLTKVYPAQTRWFPSTWMRTWVDSKVARPQENAPENAIIERSAGQTTEFKEGGVAALSSCSLEIEEGEIFGLLGPNGSGKTTLLRLLLGFMQPSRGWARVQGYDCWHQSLDVRRRVGFLPGDVRLFRQMEAREFLEFMAHMRADSDSKTDLDGLARAVQIAARLELDLSRRIVQMSTGMRQKLAIAATLSARAPLIILDEPTASLDPTVRQVLGVLLQEAQAAGTTIILSSHVLAEVEELCQRVGVMKRGRLEHVQIMQALKRQFRIEAIMTGAWQEPPESLEIRSTLDGKKVTMYTSAQLADVLPWLARLPLASLVIEPVGLRSVYEQIHPPGGHALNSKTPIPLVLDTNLSDRSPPVLDASPRANPRRP